MPTSKYGIDINISSSSEKRRGVPSARSDVRESVQQAQEMKKALVQAQKSDPSQKVNTRLVQTLQNLDTNISRLHKEIGQLSQSVRTSSRSGPGGRTPGLGGPPGPGYRFTPAGLGGAGIGRLGGSLPVAGAAIGAFGFALSKVIQIGRASISKILEQQATAGVSGLQSPTYGGVFSAAGFGQYLKERRMAAGRFDVGGTEKGEDYNVKGKSGEAALRESPLGIRATAVFGTGAQLARTAGLLDISARTQGRTGEQELSEVIRRTFRGMGEQTRGVGTELPLLLREITTSMEKAVTEGVNASDIAKDMATELVGITRATPGGQVRSAIQAQKSMIGIQQQAARGRGGAEAWRMNMAARSLLLGQGAASERVRGRLQKAGMVSATQLETLQAGRQLPPEQMQFLIRALQTQESGEVRTAFAKDVIQTMGGTGTREEKVARAHYVLSNAMPSLNWTPQQATQMFDYVQQKEAAGKYESLMSERSDIEEQLRKATRKDEGSMGRTPLAVTEGKMGTGEARLKEVAGVTKGARLGQIQLDTIPNKPSPSGVTEPTRRRAIESPKPEIEPTRRRAIESPKPEIEQRQSLENRLAELNSQIATLGEQRVELRGESGQLTSETIKSLMERVGESGLGDINRIFEDQLKRGAPTRQVMEMRGKKEGLLLNLDATKAAREATLKVDQSFITLAKNMSGTVAKSIGTVNKGIGILAERASKVVQEFEKMSKVFSSLTDGAGSAGSAMSSVLDVLGQAVKHSPVGLAVSGVTYLKNRVSGKQ